MHTNPYEVLNQTEVYSNPWVRLRVDRVRRPGAPDGVFSVVEMKQGSTVLAFNRAGEVYLVTEYKYAVARPTIELVSGGIEPGETPLDAARRELREEAGLESARWREMGVIDPFTSMVCCPNYLFMALDVTSVPACPEPGEYLSVRAVPFAEALAMVQDGRITHGGSCVLILKAALLDLPARLVGDQGFDPQSGHQDPDGDAEHTIQGEGGQQGQGDIGGQGGIESGHRRGTL